MWRILRLVWKGALLICPACGRGRMFRSRTHLHACCPQCGWIFERGHEGDWLITWVNAYGITGLVVITLLAIFNFFTAIGATAQILICSIVAIGLLIGLYPNFKGMSVAVGYVLRTTWKE